MRVTSKFLSEEEYLARMKTGALLNPRIDSTFKALFTQPTVLDFVYDKTGSQPVSRYAMRTEDNRTLSDNLNVIFIELPKVTKLEDRIGQNTALENWAIFLKDADNPEKTGVIKKLTEKETGLMNAKQSLSSISENQDLWVAQFRQEMMERDYNSGLSAAKEEGISIGEKRGRAQGLSQGLLQGRTEARLEAARNMLLDSMSNAMVAKYTGLSLEKVQQLADELKERT